MATNKFNPIERENHLAQVGELYLAGVLQHEIGARLGVTQQQISYDLRSLRTRWQASALRDFGTAKAQELAKIDRLEREYWGAWEISKQPKQKTATERGERSTKARVEKEERSPDARYLQGVQWCIERRCSILGLDAPLKHNITAAVAAVTADELAAAAREASQWETSTYGGVPGLTPPASGPPAP